MRALVIAVLLLAPLDAAACRLGPDDCRTVDSTLAGMQRFQELATRAFALHGDSPLTAALKGNAAAYDWLRRHTAREPTRIQNEIGRVALYLANLRAGKIDSSCEDAY